MNLVLIERSIQRALATVDKVHTFVRRVNSNIDRRAHCGSSSLIISMPIFTPNDVVRMGDLFRVE